jgi:hypothetical protein
MGGSRSWRMHWRRRDVRMRTFSATSAGLDPTFAAAGPSISCWANREVLL